MYLQALMRGPASVAGTATAEARHGARGVCCARCPPEAPPREGPSFFSIYAIIYSRVCANTRQQSAFKRLPNLNKACIMPWEVLEKKRADHIYTPEVRRLIPRYGVHIVFLSSWPEELNISPETRLRPGSFAQVDHHSYALLIVKVRRLIPRYGVHIVFLSSWPEELNISPETRLRPGSFAQVDHHSYGQPLFARPSCK